MTGYEPRRPIAEVRVGDWNALEVSLDGVGRSVTHRYSVLGEVRETFRDAAQAVYDLDEIEIVFPEADDVIGRHGRQRLVEAVGAQLDSGLDPEVDREAFLDGNYATYVEVIVTATDDAQIGLYVVRSYSNRSERGTQVVHLASDQAAWFADVLRRHPGLVQQRADDHDQLAEPAEGPSSEAGRGGREALVRDLLSLWEARPEQRLGQLLVNLVGRTHPEAEPMPSLYYLEDDELQSALNDMRGGMA